MTGKARDRLILAAALLVFLGGVALVAGYQSRLPQLGGPLASSYFTGPAGTKALYQLFQALGWKPTRLRVRLGHQEVLAGTDVLVLVQPVEPVSQYEAQLLREWVEEGGVLVLGFGGEPFPYFPPVRRVEESQKQKEEERRWRDRFFLPQAEHLIQEFGLNFTAGRGAPASVARDESRAGNRSAGPGELPRTEPPAARRADESRPGEEAGAQREERRAPAPTELLVDVEPGSPYTADVSQLAVTGHLRLDPKRPVQGSAREGATVLARDSEGIIAGAFPRGAGVVVVLTDTSPLTNAGLRRADNALFAVRLLEGAAGRSRSAATVTFDEYHQGFADPAGEAFAFLWFCRTPAGWATLQALAVLAGWLYLTGRRWGRPVVEERAERRSELEFVEAVAEATRGAGGAGLALRTLRRRFQQKLAQRLGLGFSGEVSASGLEAMLRQRDPELAGRVRQVLLDSAQAGVRARTSDSVLARVARQFDDLEKEMGGGDHRGRRRGRAHPD